MTPKISLITAAVGAALVLGVPAAWGDNYFADRQGATVANPDWFERAATVAKQNHLSSMLDARERALGAALDNQKVSPLDARERSLGAKLDVQLTSGQYPDWFERAAAAASRTTRDPVVDDRFRIDHSNVPVQVSATSSGREIEWPQVGIGFGIGIVLMIGLYLAMKSTRHRPLAH